MVTALFSDVVGSTSLAEAMDPEPYRKIISAFFEDMASVLEHHGGSIEKFAGDAIYATFGRTVAREDDALRAVRAALEMRDVLARLNTRTTADYNVTLSTRTGINTGEVVTGAASAPGLAVGDAINVASRLEKAAAPGEILIGEDTYRLVKDAVEAIPRTLVVKGKSRPVVAFDLLRVASDVRGLGRDFGRPMVGRAAELGVIEDVWERAIAKGSCELVLVVGGPGIGKSRLLKEAADRAQGRVRVAIGECSSYGESVTYLPLIEIIRQIAEIGAEDDQRAQESKVAALLSGHPHASLVSPRIAQLLGIDDVATASDETFWGVRKFLEAATTERATIVIVEDLHWAEGALVELIEHITDWWGGGPLAIACTARPEFLDEHPDWNRRVAHLVHLTPLDEDDSKRLMQNILGDLEAVEDVTTQVAEATGGNPLFIEQMLSMLVDQDVIARADGGWVLHGPLQLSIPPSIDALLAARLDSLPLEERAILEACAVAGREFRRIAVENLVVEPGDGRGRALLRSLVSKEFIAPQRWEVPGTETFAFRHALIHDACYRRVSRERRVQLHQRLGEWLEARREQGIDESHEAIGHHFEQAHENLVALGGQDERMLDLADRAAEHLAAAGLEAHGRHDMVSAARILKRAVVLLARRGPVPFLVLATFTDALVFEDRRDDSVLALRELERAVEHGDRRAEAELLLFRSHDSSRRDPAFEGAEAIRESERAVTIFEQLGDEAGLARAWNYLAYAYATTGQERLGLETARKAMLQAQKIGNRLEEGWARRRMAASMIAGVVGTTEALETLEDFVEWSRVADIRVDEGCAFSALAVAQGHAGMFDAARQSFTLAKSILEDVGGLVYPTLTGFGSYEIAQDLGEMRTAERDLRFSLGLLRQGGETGVTASLTARLSRVLVELQCTDEAEELLEEAQRVASRDDSDVQIYCRSTMGLLLASRGDFAGGERSIREALRLVEQTDWLFVHADLLMKLAEVVVLAGRREEALKEAPSALSLYESREHAAGAARARRLIEQLQT